MCIFCERYGIRKKDKEGYAELCQDEGGGATVGRLERLRENSGQAAGSSSVRRKCRNGTSFRQSAVSCGKQEYQCNSCGSRGNFFAFPFARVACQLFGLYLRVVARCATCALGMMGMFKWLKK
ncbi:hypothetical protein K0M31_003272 [Melipona bicolor]|uniref:Uncharacterized protein n=1 Tax=Melipona bicolor TaxID=60889 RepID=A0AA40FZK5_9HYME|nr:hypothetical protein K0M31_003272 [Melipona bicolor]